MSDEYIDLSKLEAVYDENLDLINEKEFDEKVEADGEPVYQIQGIPNEGAAYLMHVGDTAEHTSLLVDEFDLSGMFHARMISYTFRKHQLLNPSENVWMPMIRLQIFKKLQHKQLSPELASIVFSFHTCIHLQEKKQLAEYTSTQHDRTKLKGFFTIRFHTGKKYQNLRTVEAFPGHQHMCKMVMEHATDVETKKFLLQTIKKK